MADPYFIELLCIFQFPNRILNFRSLCTGWVIKLGRGLDIYKNSKSKWSPGYYDMDLRPCLQTSLDIYHGESAKLK